MLYGAICGLARFALHFVFRIKYVGRENMPKEGGALLAVNHRSNWDPIIAAAAAPRELSFMAKEELFRNPVFGGFIKKLGAFPVKRGSGDVGAFKAAMKILAQGKVMLIFPEGHRMKDGRRGKAGGGVAAISHRAKVPVVPMYIEGGYGWMSRMTVYIGKPISLEEHYGSKLTHEDQKAIAEQIMDTMWGLKDGN